MEYQCFRINPDGPDLPSQAAKYRALRLKALKESPQSFSSSYEIESQFPDEIWISRIQETGKTTFVCSATSGDSSEWVGQVSLRGPLSVEEFRLPQESGQNPPESDDQVQRWQMLSLYTLPSHRGKGLAKALCQTAFDFAVSHAKPTAVNTTIRIMVKPDNKATLSMYKSLGFKETGSCTLEEALRANGDANLLPEGSLNEEYTTRTGVIMELHLSQGS